MSNINTMGLEKILKLGDQRLYCKSEPVEPLELSELMESIELLLNLIKKFRSKYGTGRGIAAPLIGLMKRIICLNIDNEEHVLINPLLSNFSSEMMNIWDDCMCFPNLLVNVERHKSCSVTFNNLYFQEITWKPEGSLSELIQHEYDHLDGILATQRAIDGKSFRYKQNHNIS